MKAFVNTVKLGNPKINAAKLCKCIEENMVTGEGNFTRTPSNAKVSMFLIDINRETANNNNSSASALRLSCLE